MQLPKSLPDESFYSRICRHFILSGLTKEQYLFSIFGNSRASLHPYLNANLSVVCQSLNQSAEEIWLNQTLLPLFYHFLPNSRKVIGDTNSPSRILI